MSKIEIINRALLKLGEPPVSSLNDAAFGKSYGMVYEDVRNLLLSTYPWRFAVEVKRLAKREEKYGGRAMYQLPKDCLLVLRVFGVATPEVTGIRLAAMSGYELANGAVVTENEDGVAAEYVKSIDDEGVFPPLFREALAAKIAAELSMRIKHSLELKQTFENEFFALIRQAELNNEIEKSREILPDNSWVWVRNSW